MRAVVSPDDLKRGELISEAGWQPCEVSKYEEKEAGTDKSTNCLFYFTIIDGKDKGKGGRLLLNEKALGFGKNFYPAVGFPKNADGGYDLTSEMFQSAVGKKLKVYFKRGKSNKDNEFNDPADFMPLS